MVALPAARCDELLRARRELRPRRVGALIDQAAHQHLPARPAEHRLQLVDPVVLARVGDRPEDGVPRQEVDARQLEPAPHKELARRYRVEEHVP
eukprot:4263009-Prymnesium_polylepis.1